MHAFTYRGILYLVMNDTNLERIKKFDPFVFDGSKVPVTFTLVMPLQIVVCYCPAEDLEVFLAMPSEEKHKWLTRGWTNQAGDHDEMYTVKPK